LLLFRCTTKLRIRPKTGSQAILTWTPERLLRSPFSGSQDNRYFYDTTETVEWTNRLFHRETGKQAPSQLASKPTEER
jgi:hypothetical protein